VIAGASGAIGRALMRRLRANQHEVFALTQSRDSAAVLKESGAEPVIADALDAVAVKAAAGQIRPDAVINELTSLPWHYMPAEMKAAAEPRWQGPSGRQHRPVTKRAVSPVMLPPSQRTGSIRPGIQRSSRRREGWHR
jgi:NAD(P)-dependent dehydrogenase (short-subunit alcohol dehydrogenase family)